MLDQSWIQPVLSGAVGFVSLTAAGQPFEVAAAVAVMLVVVMKVVFGGPKVLLKDPEGKTKYKVKLIDREEVSHDVRRFRFELPPDHALGLPVGKHVYLTATVQVVDEETGETKNKLVVRPYTPVTSDENKGYFDLVLKIYFKNVHPKFPQGGAMSQYLNDMKIGDMMDVRGPTGHVTFKGDGVFALEGKDGVVHETRKAKHIGMIAGGTGITPMLQIIRDILKDKDNTTNISLLFANQTVDDIILRKELEACNADPRFNLWYTVDRPPTTGWEYSSGFISANMIKEHLPAYGDDVQILMCGPPPMLKYACLPALTELGFSEKNWISW